MPGALVNPWPTPLGMFPVSPERDLCEKCLKGISSSLHRQSILDVPKRTRSCGKGHVLRSLTLAFLERLFFALQPLFLSLLQTPFQVRLSDASYTHIPTKPWTNRGTAVFCRGSGHPEKPLNYAPNFGSAYVCIFEVDRISSSLDAAC